MTHAGRRVSLSTTNNTILFQFTNSVLDDKCYSKDNPEFKGKFRSSLSISTGTSERETISTFFRTYYQSRG